MVGNEYDMGLRYQAPRLNKMQLCRIRKKDRGECSECSNQVEMGRRLCSVCLDRDKKRSRKRYAEDKRRRLCTHCHKPLGTNDVGFVSHNRNECRRSREIAI